MGKILHVDLSSGEIREEALSDDFYRKFLSGAGLAAKVLYDRIPKGADPLGPDNVLAFVSGLLTGTGAFLTGRWMVAAKSPLTGGYGEANCGGTFSPAIKRCGYDGIFFRGISEKPVLLRITDGKAQLADASHVWGKDAVESERILTEEAGGKARVAVIGQAGENLSLISGVCNDRGRIAARSGLGAVMGSKRLKAVVLQGKVKIPVEDPEAMKKLNQQFMKWFKAGEALESKFPTKLFALLGRFFRVAPVAPRRSRTGRAPATGTSPSTPTPESSTPSGSSTVSFASTTASAAPWGAAASARSPRESTPWKRPTNRNTKPAVPSARFNSTTISTPCSRSTMS